MVHLLVDDPKACFNITAKKRCQTGLEEAHVPAWQMSRASSYVPSKLISVWNDWFKLMSLVSVLSPEWLTRSDAFINSMKAMSNDSFCSPYFSCSWWRELMLIRERPDLKPHCDSGYPVSQLLRITGVNTLLTTLSSNISSTTVKVTSAAFIYLLTYFYSVTCSHKALLLLLSLDKAGRTGDPARHHWHTDILLYAV